MALANGEMGVKWCSVGFSKRTKRERPSRLLWVRIAAVCVCILVHLCCVKEASGVEVASVWQGASGFRRMPTKKKGAEACAWVPGRNIVPRHLHRVCGHSGSQINTRHQRFDTSKVATARHPQASSRESFQAAAAEICHDALVLGDASSHRGVSIVVRGKREAAFGALHVLLARPGRLAWFLRRLAKSAG